jgi:hypothetical protein
MKYSMFVLATMCLLSSPVMAQSQFDASGRRVEAEDQEPMTLEQMLPEINKSSVINGGKYVTSRAMMKRQLRDSGSKVVGEVKDIYVGSGGSVASVVGTFTRLHLKGPVALDLQADGMTGVEDGYKMGFSGEEIKSLFPDLVTRTKESSPTKNGVSVVKLVGADVMSIGGEQVGTLKEVLFDAVGEHVNLAYLIVNYGPFKNKPVVVPFGISELQTTRGKPSLVIAEEDLETVFKYLTSKMKK